MNLENFINLSTWVEELNSKIQEILLERLKEAIALWIREFESEKRTADISGYKMRKSTHSQPTDEYDAKSKTIAVEGILHELSIRNQVIYLDPPLDYARSKCFSSLHKWLGLSIFRFLLTL
jgi:dynein heavy chain 1, cytosolic